MYRRAIATRSLPPPDPMGEPPRGDVAPNPNPPTGSVGPNVPIAGDTSAQAGEPGGFGATHAVYDGDSPPLQAMAWAGWPSNWDVPSNLTGSPAWMSGGSDIAFAALDKNAVAFADMPVTVEKRRVAVTPPTWLQNPCPPVYSQWGEFARQAWMSYQALGETFIVVTSRFMDDDRPRTFMVVDPWLVNAEIVDGRRVYSIGGVDATSDILHIRYQSWPGDARGHGPLEVARERMLAVKVLMRYGADLASSGGIPWGVLTSKYRITQEQSDRLKMQWISAARTRMGAPAILDGELKLDVLQVTPKDMMLSDLQKFAEARISVLLGVPPHLLALPNEASMTYTNVQDIYDAHWRGTLRPHGNYILRAISNWALPSGTDLLLNATSYTRPGPQERANYYQIMSNIRDPRNGSPAITVTEIRTAEQLAPEALTDESSQPAPQEVESGALA